MKAAPAPLTSAAPAVGNATHGNMTSAGGGNMTSPASNNTPPTANDQSVTTNQNTSTDITLTGNDPDQSDTLTAAIVTNPSHGTLSSINQENGVVTYTPNSRFIGDDSFTFKVNDGKTDSRNTGTVTISIKGAQ